jgi:hypothetical protein
VGRIACVGARRVLLGRWITVALLGALSMWFPLFVPPYTSAAESQFVSIHDGHWSDPNTWEPRGVPAAHASVVIAKGTRVEYDVASEREIAFLTIEGTLEFSRTQPTRLDTGSVYVRAGGVLAIGTEQRPIPRDVTAEIRLVVPEGVTFQGGGFAKEDVGIWVFSGGLWELHGSPVKHSWTKLARPARVGDTDILVGEDLTDWPRGADVVVTPTGIRPGEKDFEERKVVRVRRVSGGVYAVTVAGPLSVAHDGGDFAGEIALLTRNVRIVSKYPSRTKAHTIFMAGGKGSIAYGEFKELGPLGVLGRYPIHFHLMGDSSRGMYVRGASIWRSDTHFLNIHASNGITVEDTVGYDAAGSGFFLEPAAGQPHPMEHGKAPGAGRPPKAPAGQEPQKGKPIDRQPVPMRGLPGENIDTVFLHNLAAKGFWRPGSLDDHTVGLFWISSLNTVLIDNVAVGSQGGKANSGFRLSDESPSSRTDTLLTMVSNESHSNGDNGFLSWLNNQSVLDIIGFNAWRNGRAGMMLGAYDHRVRVFGARLSENGEMSIDVWVVRAWVQDSTLRRSKFGILFNEHALPSDPQNPALIVNTRFSEDTIADVSQVHLACESPGDEHSPYSRRCPANYALFAQPTFSSPRAIDFGWQKNANSWFEILDWSSPPAGVPSSFRVLRRDQAGDQTRLFAPFGGQIGPVQRTWDYPPRVTIATLGAGPTAGSITAQAVAHGSRGIAAVEFFANGVMVKRVTVAPYQVAWTPGRAVAQRIYIYARAIDMAASVAYSPAVEVLVTRP